MSVGVQFGNGVCQMRAIKDVSLSDHPSSCLGKHTCYAMAEEIDRVITSIQGLSLANGTTDLPSLRSRRAANSKRNLEGATKALILATEATTSHAQQLLSVADKISGPGHDLARLVSLRRRAKALADITVTFGDALDCYILSQIKSLAGPGTTAEKLLSHFDAHLRGIIQDVVSSTTDEGSVLREILERCYSESLQRSGTLNFDNYADPLDETCLESPYDPDFESEEYYEHENRLEVDEDYANTFRYNRRLKAERKEQEHKKKKENWIGFWVKALQRCHNGPTLFYPPASHLSQCHLTDVPRYLFRTFDQASSGRSNEDVVASVERISDESNSRVDILSKPTEVSIRMLHGHLTKLCFGGGDESDNLMSWSSSLLFVIQYAVWRCHHRRCGEDEVKICAVDTRKFPRGQFARDITLLRAYRQTAKHNEGMNEFFDFRLNREDYDNGEFLSQGQVHHKGRSSMVSLDQLIKAGLHDLYPEFKEESEKSSWTNRVRSLRSRWSAEQSTTKLDIQAALSVARVCFKTFEPPDIAMLLLLFKNRKLRPTTTTTTRPPSFHSVTGKCQGVFKDYGPEEVQRYMKILETTAFGDRDNKAGDSFRKPLSFAQGPQLLKDVFDCS